MTTEKVIAIVAVMMFLEYLYVKQNAASLVSNAVTGSAPAALGDAAAGALVDVGAQIAGLI